MKLLTIPAAARLLVGLMFLCASAAKTADIWRGNPHASTMISVARIPGEAPIYILVALEGVLGTWLLTGAFSRTAVLTSIVLLSAFSGAVGFELTKERPKPCGCFGSDASELDPSHVRRELAGSLLRNCVAIGILVTAARLQRPGSPKCAGPAVDPSCDPPGPSGCPPKTDGGSL